MTVLNKSSGGIYSGELAALTFLNLGGLNISSITGLQYCTSLETLYLYNNNVTDLTPLQNLTTLKQLLASSNPVGSIDALSGLVNLERLELGNSGGGMTISDTTKLSALTKITNLYLGYCNLTEINGLSSMPGLTAVNLFSNSITSIAPLAGCTGLAWLNLGSNQVSNVDALGGMTYLNWVGLHYNSLTTNIHGLVTNAAAGGLGSYTTDTVNLQGNNLSGAALTDIDTLRNTYGVIVTYP
jgi:Leucine-rich repeat (LRR) protein